MSDKTTMLQNYYNIEAALINAEENLRQAEDILRRNFVVNYKGYCANELHDKINEIYSYRQDVVNRIIPEIKKL